MIHAILLTTALGQDIVTVSDIKYNFPILLIQTELTQHFLQVLHALQKMTARAILSALTANAVPVLGQVTVLVCQYWKLALSGGAIQTDS